MSFENRLGGILGIFLVWGALFLIAAIAAAMFDVGWLPAIPVLGAMLHTAVHLARR